VHPVQGQVPRRVDGVGGEVEDAAAADRGQLVPVAEQRHPHPALVCDGEQGAGGVLVEHAGLVDDQQIPWPQSRGLLRAGVDPAGDRIGLPGLEPGPGAVGVPAPAVLVGQPRRRPSRRAHPGGGDLGGLQRRGDHYQPATLVVEQVPGGGQGGRLAGAGRTLHHGQRAVAGQRGDRR
jgi:hypothetical protein